MNGVGAWSRFRCRFARLGLVCVSRLWFGFRVLRFFFKILGGPPNQRYAFFLEIQGGCFSGLAARSVVFGRNSPAEIGETNYALS